MIHLCWATDFVPTPSGAFSVGDCVYNSGLANNRSCSRCQDDGACGYFPNERSCRLLHEFCSSNLTTKREESGNTSLIIYAIILVLLLVPTVAAWRIFICLRQRQKREVKAMLGRWADRRRLAGSTAPTTNAQASD